MENYSAIHHEALEHLLFQCRFTNHYPEELDDIITEIMSDLWHKMTRNEQIKAEERIDKEIKFEDAKRLLRECKNLLLNKQEKIVELHLASQIKTFLNEI